MNVTRFSVVVALAGVVVAAGLPGCGEGLLNQIASLGGSTAGGRGRVRVVFINNTPHQAVFTFGSYDQTDPHYEPDFTQVGLSESGTTLDGNATSGIGAIECARVFSVGGPELLALIEANVADATVDEDALVEGVEFFSAAADDADDPVSEGAAPALEALLGVDFPCGALLIIRFEPDDQGPDPFRIDFELIPSESTR